MWEGVGCCWPDGKLVLCCFSCLASLLCLPPCFHFFHTLPFSVHPHECACCPPCLRRSAAACLRARSATTPCLRARLATPHRPPSTSRPSPAACQPVGWRLAGSWTATRLAGELHAQPHAMRCRVADKDHICLSVADKAHICRPLHSWQARPSLVQRLAATARRPPPASSWLRSCTRVRELSVPLLGVQQIWPPLGVRASCDTHGSAHVGFGSHQCP